jgi:hypothetical protein
MVNSRVKSALIQNNDSGLLCILVIRTNIIRQVGRADKVLFVSYAMLDDSRVEWAREQADNNVVLGNNIGEGSIVGNVELDGDQSHRSIRLAGGSVHRASNCLRVLDGNIRDGNNVGGVASQIANAWA